MATIETIEGKLEEIIFRNEENGYTIGIVQDGEGWLTAVGTLSSCHVGKTYRMEGQWVEHRKYGPQFSFTLAREVLPSTVEGMEAFLASGAISGIGKKVAKAMVETFGEDTFDIIENHPKKLEKIHGLGKKRIEALRATFLQERHLAQINAYLGQFSLSPEQIVRIYGIFGEDTVEQIKKNPYSLMEEEVGMGFLKADKIAQELDFSMENPFRIQGGIKYFMGKTVKEGHTHYPRKELAESVGQMLEVSRDQVDEQLVELALEGILKMETLADREVVFLMAYYLAEQNIAYRLKLLNTAEIKPMEKDIFALIAQAEAHSSISYSDEQKQAIYDCLQNGVSVLTGGPGTGKTTIINGIKEVVHSFEGQIALCAPTGRAAKRITETTGQEGHTIHRLLEYSYWEEANRMVFGKNRENPLEVDVVIVDETSMVDTLLLDALVNALSPGTRLIFVGDVDQLPSVGPGNVLKDIVHSEYVFSIALKTIFRQAQESMIVVNAHRVNKGESPYLNEKEKDFFFLERNQGQAIVDTVVDLWENRLPRYKEDCHKIKDIQVLSPVRKGPVGTLELNQRIQDRLNPTGPDKKEVRLGSRTFREGDKVMQIKNNYETPWRSGKDFSQGKGVFNGDMGILKTLDEENQTMTVVFDEERFVEYDFAHNEELELAYAITVHKAQGSEFPLIIMPMTWFPPVLANKNLLYTAITRGKELVVLVGTRNSMMAMIENDKRGTRYSSLGYRLGEYMNEV